MAQTDPPPRRGPRPLPIHLGAALAAWTSSSAALPLWRSGWQPWSAALRPKADALARELARHPGPRRPDGADPDALAAALDREILTRLERFLLGIEAYRRHPYRRALKDPSPALVQGTTRLLDFGRDAGRRGGVPLLVVPSLINRGYILDLQPRRSLLRWLAGRGFRPFLVDWAAPGPAERGFSLGDYVAGRLERLLDEVIALSGRPPLLLGYCMGGLLAVALAQRRQRDLCGMALLASPWDFHTEGPAAAAAMGALSLQLEPLLDLLGALPVDVIQCLFATRDPLSALRKFAAFAALDPAGARARDFVALEDWLNDGVPLAAPVARECLGGWYARNEPARGAWRVAGQAVDPRSVDLPSLCVLPARDRIVPPASARVLAEALADGPGRSSVLEPEVGHIGMIVGGGARRAVWRPLADWLNETAEAA